MAVLPDLTQKTPLQTPLFTASGRLAGSYSAPQGLDVPMTETDKRDYRDEKAWLDARLKDAANFEEPVALPMAKLVTPGLARLLLEKNENNRRVNRGVVERYKKDIKQGLWAINGENVKVAKDGSLNDGQHRLMAILESGKAQKLMFVFNLPFDARRTVDQGLKRTIAGNLEMAGIDDAGDISSVASMLAAYKEFGGISKGGYRAPTHGMRYDTAIYYHDQIRGALDYVRNAAAGGKGRNKKTFGSMAPFAFGYLLLLSEGANGNEELVQSYFKGVLSGASLKENDPRLAARNRLITLKGVANASDKVSVLIRGWNAYIERRPIQQIHMPQKKKGQSVQTLPTITRL
jgi:hypothetical protein